ncbi:MAG: hypothetical protein FWF63_07755, partial [Fibromonadales bacterium]|nr:hypothetical protein [Fibromonadales bacterium]
MIINKTNCAAKYSIVAITATKYPAMNQNTAISPLNASTMSAFDDFSTVPSEYVVVVTLMELDTCSNPSQP